MVEKISIDVLVNSGSVVDLTTKLKQLRSQWNGMSADARSSPAGRELSDQINQINVAIKTANPNVEGIRQKFRELRGEHRLVSFGMMSLIGTFDAFGEKNKELTNSIKSTVAATTGLYFGLSMLPGVLGELAFPIAGVVTAATMLYNAFNQDEESAEAIQKRFIELSKVQKEYNAAVGGAETGKIIATTPNEFERNAKLLGAYKNQLQDVESVYESYLRTNREYTKEGLAAQTDYYKALKIVADQQKVILNYDINIRNQRAESAARYSQIAHERLRSSGFGGRPGELTRRAQIQNEMIQQEDRRAAAEAAATGTGFAGQQTTIAGAELTRGGQYESEQSFTARQAIVMDVALQKTKEMNKTTELIARSFDRVGTSIEQNLISKLHTSNTLAGQLLNELLTSAVELAGSVASGGASPGFQGLYLALVGAGKNRASGT